MKFNFECWALVEIRYPDEEDGCLDKLRGFWATRPELDRGQEAIEANRRALYRQREDEHKRNFPFLHPFDWDYEPGVYVPVLISQMQFKDLSEAEEMILKDARLAFKGCGVAVSVGGQP